MSPQIVGQRFDWIVYGGRRGRIMEVTGVTPLYRVAYPDRSDLFVPHGPGVTVIKSPLAALVAEFGELKPVTSGRDLRISRRARRRMLRRELRLRRSPPSRPAAAARDRRPVRPG